MNKLTDYDVYNSRMTAGIEDKLFFLDNIDINDVDTVIDFGCADGQILKLLPNQWNKIGVDNSIDMLDLAVRNYPKAKYFTKLSDACAHMTDKTLLLFSSVWHEIFSYCDKIEIDSIINEFTVEHHFKYIVIRDMASSFLGDIPADEKDIEKIRKNKHGKLFDDFQQRFLKNKQITENDLIHYLLKYRYEENWSRECVENYFAMPEKFFIEKLKPYNYEVIYYDRFVLPYIRKIVREDFDFEIKYPTHEKLILRGF